MPKESEGRLRIAGKHMIPAILNLAACFANGPGNEIVNFGDFRKTTSYTFYACVVVISKWRQNSKMVDIFKIHFSLLHVLGVF